MADCSNDAKKAAFQHLCEDYADKFLSENADKCTVGEETVEEKVIQALFKIEEASALLEANRSQQQETATALINELYEKTNLLEQEFKKIDQYLKLVEAMKISMNCLDERFIEVKRAADPILPTNSVSQLLRSFNMKGAKSSNSAEHSSKQLEWKSIDIVNVKDFFKSNIGASILKKEER